MLLNNSSIFGIGNYFSCRNRLLLTWDLRYFRPDWWRFLNYWLSFGYLILHRRRFDCRSRVTICIFGWLRLIILWVTGSFSLFVGNFKDLICSFELEVVDITSLWWVWTFGIFSFGQWLPSWNYWGLGWKNIRFLTVGVLSCRLGTLNVRFYLIYLSWRIDILIIVDLTGVAVLSGYWNQILGFAWLGFSRWFLNFWRRSLFRGMNEMLILLVVRERSSSLWASDRTFPWWSNLAVLAAAMFWSHLSIMSSPSCKFLFRVKCSFSTNIRGITLGKYLRAITIFPRSCCSVVKNPASAFLLGLAEMLFNNFIELQLGVVNK